LDLSTKELWKIIVDSWDYEESKKIIRDIFRKTDKYKNGKEADNAMNVLIKEWKSLKLGDIAWPFSQGAFDDFVQRINSEKENGFVKDGKVKAAAVKYRRIKEINTVRNDFIETLIFEKNNNILPTLSHRRGVDFFINGISFDQKVAKSPTNEFKRHFKGDWRKMAIKKPELVAEYLYKYPDLFEGDYKKIKNDIIRHVAEACKITNLSRNDLLEGLDLDGRDLSKEKIESFLAELRAIFLLDNFKFNNILPLKQKKNQKNPDFEAEYIGKRVVVEVFCLTATHGQEKDRRLNCYINFNDRWQKAFIEKAEKKKDQLDVKNDVSMKILVCVINSRPVKALNGYDDFVNMLEIISRSLTWGKSYYLGICTGQVDLKSCKMNDCFYPSL
jgi:hypothetical protein